MKNVGFCINYNFQRPQKELIEAFRGLPAANLADCMNRISCIDAAIRPINNALLLGCAFTVRSPGGENLLFNKALEIAQPGDVIVVSDNGEQQRSCCGEIMAMYARYKKINGFVINGCIRDVDTISKMDDFPVYARGVMANGPYKNGPGEINVPVSMGNVIVNPGDILVGDADGVVVIKPSEAEYVLQKIKPFIENENKIRSDILAGKQIDRSWIDKLLNEKNCQIIK
jgi:regulator of RNase E activity RraA